MKMIYLLNIVKIKVNDYFDRRFYFGEKYG